MTITPTQKYFRNRLISAMSLSDFALLQPHLELVSLEVQQVLVEPNQPIEHVYFLEHGIISLVAVSPSGERIEVGNVGREGLAGVSVLNYVTRSPLLSFVQVPGPASRMPTGDLLSAVEASLTLRRLLSRYVESTVIQMAHTALANGRHTLSQRLSRWLLMSQDRLERNEIPLTHEFLSLMLGVRRPGVTEALHMLEGEHIIKAVRGSITILDREKLERVAADSYGIPESEYTRLIGNGALPASPRNPLITDESAP